MITADELYNAIALIERRKWREGRSPAHVLRITELFPELKQYGLRESDIDFALRELKNDERIDAGKTANDTWIKTK